MSVNSDTWVVIPAYNEEKKIGDVLSELVQYPYHVVVVDDGSRDQTRNSALYYPVTVLRHITNLGQGAALQTGIRYALLFPETHYIATFDADGQHSARDIQPMLELCRSGSHDIVLGSRFLEKGKVINMEWRRGLVLKAAILFTRLMTGMKLTDTHNGLRVLTAEAAAKLNLTQNGMAHASELLSQVAALKLRYCEAPVTITYSDYSRQKGQSLWNGFNILWDMLEGFLR